MKLLKGSVFLRDHFEKPKPTKKQLIEWIDDGEMPGRIIAGEPYVYINLWLGAGARYVKPEQEPSGLELLL